MKTLMSIARKEFAGFFSSPMAYIFLGAFLAVCLFVFFWVERFFAANIAEVRPLFTWMPVLLIFLTGAVTMRMWAEERRSGTLEFLLTSPVSPLALVLGKFLACLWLVGLALLLTLPLAVTVSLLGPLDWGPVWGGYLASLFLAGAYIAIGLFVSSRSDNQIVSLIVSSLICLIFYLLGSETLSVFFGNRGAELLGLLGSGSRFDSITRGVIDLRDLCYYLSIIGIFLTGNIYGLERLRWADNPSRPVHRRWGWLCGLVVANFVAMNLWLAPVGSLRVDLTRGNMYSISPATRNYLAQLQEPLLIRGYFSAQTHPLLAPLVPRLRDLLKEYDEAGGGKIRVEFIDPLEHPELEQEAGQRYGIRPVPFQTASKYQAAVTNSYFDLLVQYGDQFEVLGFRDLIEVKMAGEQDLEVELRNPEYDITRAIKKVLYSYQGGGDLFATIGRPVAFTGYFSDDRNLPQELIELKRQVQELVEELTKESGDKFTATIVDPDADGGKEAERLQTEYGFRPMAASLFDDRSFWFYMMLASGEQLVEVPLPEDLSKESLRRALDSSLKRFATGFAKTVALHTPPTVPPMPQYGMPGRGPQYNLVKELLSKDHVVTDTDLASGHVPEAADILVLLAPENLDSKQLFAVDQFLMMGGTVVLATSPYNISLEQEIRTSPAKSGLEEWLAHYGISMAQEMVLDPRNTPFPVPVQRQLGGFTVQETRLIDYPYFADLRPDQMDAASGLLMGLNQLTMTWASPIIVDEEVNKGRRVIRLLKSSEESWVSATPELQPDFQTAGELGFLPAADRGQKLVGLVVEGSFSSYFSGKDSPLLAAKEPAVTEEAAGQEQKTERVISRMLEKSPESARIILFSSGSFVSDTIISIASNVMRTGYLNPVQLLSNTVDWSLEERSLLEMRGRSHFAQPLLPLSTDLQVFFEYFNYGLALFGLLVVWLVRRRQRRQAHRRNTALLAQLEGRM